MISCRLCTLCTLHKATFYRNNPPPRAFPYLHGQCIIDDRRQRGIEWGHHCATITRELFTHLRFSPILLPPPPPPPSSLFCCSQNVTELHPLLTYESISLPPAALPLSQNMKSEDFLRPFNLGPAAANLLVHFDFRDYAPAALPSSSLFMAVRSIKIMLGPRLRLLTLTK